LGKIGVALGFGTRFDMIRSNGEAVPFVPIVVQNKSVLLFIAASPFL
jgi:hypothetical protein